MPANLAVEQNQCQGTSIYRSGYSTLPRLLDLLPPKPTTRNSKKAGGRDQWAVIALPDGCLAAHSDSTPTGSGGKGSGILFDELKKMLAEEGITVRMAGLFAPEPEKALSLLDGAAGR